VLRLKQSCSAGVAEGRGVDGRRLCVEHQVAEVAVGASQLMVREQGEDQSLCLDVGAKRCGVEDLHATCDGELLQITRELSAEPSAMPVIDHEHRHIRFVSQG
jgi:hypothetical protein